MDFVDQKRSGIILKNFLFQICFSYHTILFPKMQSFFRICLDFFPDLCYSRKQMRTFVLNTGGFYG